MTFYFVKGEWDIFDTICEEVLSVILIISSRILFTNIMSKPQGILEYIHYIRSILQILTSFDVSSYFIIECNQLQYV